MRACTEPVRTGIGAVCVEYGRPKWPITMLNHTNKQTSLVQNNVWFFTFWHPMLVVPVIKRLFFSWKTKVEKARFACAPHYYMGCVSYMGIQGFQGEVTSPGFSLLRARKRKMLLSVSMQPNKYSVSDNGTCIMSKPKKRYRYHTQRNLIP